MAHGQQRRATLLLLYVTEAFPGAAFLDIYQHTADNTRLVRTLHAEDLWTRHEIDPEGKTIIVFKGSSRFWLLFGSLRFTPDNQNLLYTSPEGHHLRIRLADGAVTRLS